MKLFQKLFGGGGRGVAELAQWLAVSETELRNCPANYSEFTIPKRRGGARTIHAPDDALKAMQRRILHRLLNPLPLHPAATGFVRKRSIVDNARPHASQGVVINLDLADFFHSIRAERVTEVFRKRGWGREAAELLTKLCTHDGRLPQGAPTSPALSNLVCWRLDARLMALAQKAGGSYTRYADDLTFSFPGFGWNKRRRRKPRGVPLIRRLRQASRGLLRTIRTILQEEGFQIQKRKKVRVQRAHQRQTATGLVVNRGVNLPREVRRRIRAMQHRERLGQLAPAQKAVLRGWEGLAAMVRGARGGV